MRGASGVAGRVPGAQPFGLLALSIVVQVHLLRSGIRKRERDRGAARGTALGGSLSAGMLIWVCAGDGDLLARDRPRRFHLDQSLRGAGWDHSAGPAPRPQPR